jgi:hypothetical protein
MTSNSNHLRSNQYSPNADGERAIENAATVNIQQVEDSLDEEDPDLDKYEDNFYIDEDVNDYASEEKPDLYANFDEKEEIIDEAENFLAVRPKSADILDQKENSSSYLSHEQNVQKSSNPDFSKLVQTENLLNNRHRSKSALSEQQPIITTLEQDFDELDFFQKSEYDEKILIHLNNVSCLCDTNNVLHSKENKTTMDTNKYLNGKLILTSYRLLFLPYHSDDKINDLNSLFIIDRNLQLFNNKSSMLAFVIPLSFIYDIKASR